MERGKLNYPAYKTEWVNRTKTMWFPPSFSTGKERDEETGYGYFGARYMDHELMTMWLSVDPLSDKYPNISPYNYCMWNPVKLVDPDGEEISTHTDELGNVVKVYNDGDNGVYRHKGDRNYTQKELQENYSASNTSAEGERMGETEFWDEFVSPEDGSTLTDTKIQFGRSFMPIIEEKHRKSLGMSLAEIASESAGGGDFDIKNKYKNVGGLLNGKYVTSRSAGDFLAGYNASTGKMLGLGTTFNTFQRLAGALHIQESGGNKLSKRQMLGIVLNGTFWPSNPSDIEKFKAPTYGENYYQYRMSRMGWDYGSLKK